MKLFNRQEAGTASIRVTWRVVELWKIPAADLLDAGDVGLLPLVPLADFDGPLEPIVEACPDLASFREQVAVKKRRRRAYAPIDPPTASD